MNDFLTPGGVLNIWTFVAGFAVILTAVQLFPQLYQSIKTKRVRDVSLGFALLVAVGSLTWLSYGIHIGDRAVITANAINLFGGAILIYLKLSQEEQ